MQQVCVIPAKLVIQTREPLLLDEVWFRRARASPNAIMAFASRAIPIAYRSSSMGIRSPDRMPVDDGGNRWEPITADTHASTGSVRPPWIKLPSNLDSFRAPSPSTHSTARSTASLVSKASPGTPSSVPPPGLRTTSSAMPRDDQEGLRSSSPTFASERRGRTPTPIDMAVRPSTPGTFWKPDHKPNELSPPTVSRQGCMQRHPIVWQAEGSSLFPVAWHDSPQLREPLKSPRKVATLRSNSAALLRSPSRLKPHELFRQVPILRIRDSERACVDPRSLTLYRQPQPLVANATSEDEGHSQSVKTPRSISCNKIRVVRR